MKPSFSLLCLLLAGYDVTAQAQMEMQPSSRPNIILFLVDDMGWQDTSLPFWDQKTSNNNIYETPNMERLARKGMMFTQAYANSISSPSRVSLFTGMNSSRHRVTNWTLERNVSTDNKNEVLEFPEWNVNGFCQQPNIERSTYATSLAQVLKNSGYHTIHCGKAHFAARTTPGENPLNLGFDINIAGFAGGAPGSYLAADNFGNHTDGTPSSPFAIPGLNKYYGKDLFLTEILTKEALQSLDNRDKRKPFFLYMSHYAIHGPLDRDMRYFAKYKAKGLSNMDAAYAALIEGMDKSLGDIMNYLDEKQLTENTIILFMSDNGGYAMEKYDNTPPFFHNAPLNSGKGSAYEGGIREPMIVSWPGKTPAGSACHEYVIIEDFYPTILEMAEIKKYKTVQQIDGKSFVSLLKQTGNPSKNRSLYWNFPNGWGYNAPGLGATCTIRKGNWKLIYYYETGKKELFNIQSDISEQVNLADKEQNRVKKMSKELGAYLRKTKAQRPKIKRTGNNAPWPDE